VLAGRRAGCAESTLVPASTNHGVPSVTLQTPDVVRGPIASAQFEVGAGRREGGAPVQRDSPSTGLLTSGLRPANLVSRVRPSVSSEAGSSSARDPVQQLTCIDHEGINNRTGISESE
jgi:hypothetical protein